MIVGITGFGCSGSSAVVDYLKGFSSVYFFDNSIDPLEFQIIHEADGINDLKFHLTKSHERVGCNAAIQRFNKLLEKGAWGHRMKVLLGDKYEKWCQDYIDELVQIKWEASTDSWADPPDICRVHFKEKETNPYVVWAKKIEKRINRIRKRLFNYKTEERIIIDRYFSMLTEQEFDLITTKYLEELFCMLGLRPENINLLDMPTSCTNPLLGLEFIKDSKCIVVDRDPRDLWVTAIRIREFSRFMPNDDVRKFVVYYKKMHELMELSDDVLLLKYEDMIYKYYESTERIKEFVGLSGTPDREFKFFNPLVSAKYTNRRQFYEEVQDDIRLIEMELRDYLYDFTNVMSPYENVQLVMDIGDIVYDGTNGELN